MVRFATLLLATILSAAALAAQNPASSSEGHSGQTQGQKPHQSSGLSSLETAVVQYGASSCPVSMRAERRAGGRAITTGRAPTSGSAQYIRVILNKILGETGSSARVTAATVTVRGTNGAGRLATGSQFQMSPPPKSPYLERKINLALFNESDGSEISNLDLSGFTSVSSIRLDSVTFADGTVWTPDSGHICRVEPDPLMLVTTR